ncbi:hypothetical protein IB232_12400 [Pseudomonas sp. PDM15]|uniref:hypothetical protein n=1 Tax=Pseudomonas sp. PDM15 TaxID=2769303 RepID=UPI00178680A3|nr:hypothetical protein [Pseudomonas sp. PDM15]MBD9426127.1 hypothetical protein [Pseudomonas sp. PDM15]
MLRTITCLLLALLLGGCSDDSQPSAAERQLLLTGADFGYGEDAGYFGKTTTYWTRTTDLSYDSEPLSGLYLHSTVSLTPSAGEALMASYSSLQGAGIALGLLGEGVTEEEIELTRKLGSHAKLVLLRKDGEPIGNMFSVSIGKKILFTVFTGGHYFDSGAEFEAFIAPKLAALEAHQYDDPIVGWGKGLFADEDDGEQEVH